MKAFAPRPAAGKAATPAPHQAVAVLDNRPGTVAQRRQLAAIAGSPRQVAQRQQAAPALAAPRANRTGLPDHLKAGVESLSGHSLDDVKVYYNSARPAQLQALAYAQGTAIHLGPGQEKHLPHEAWHVAQQKQGRVRATTQLKGVGVNDNAGLEKEADVMGARAMKIINKPDVILQQGVNNHIATITDLDKSELIQKMAAPGPNERDNFMLVDPANYTCDGVQRTTQGRGHGTGTRWFKINYGGTGSFTLHVHLTGAGGINHDHNKIKDDNGVNYHVNLNTISGATTKVKSLNPFRTR